jgi:hypothetical protein
MHAQMDTQFALFLCAIVNFDVDPNCMESLPPQERRIFCKCSWAAFAQELFGIDLKGEQP